MTFPSLPNQDFFENYAEAVLITKDDDTSVFVNAAFTKLTGFSAEKLHLINTINLFQEQVNFPSGKVKKNNKWETALTKADSSVSYVNVSISEILFADKSIGRVYTITDNSVLHRMQGVLRESEKQLARAKRELAEQGKELMQANEELEQFAYVASHDIQEPLRMITSYIQLLQKNIEQGNTKNTNEFMQFVLEGADRMQSLINDLLQFSRVNRKGNAFAEADLNKIVSVAMTHLANQIKESDTKITVEKLPAIYCDSSQLLRLFQNLLDNAIKFKSPDRKPAIRISVEEKEPGYLFSIKDNGIGIADKYYDRIFVIFQRLHSRSEYEGTGIGLAVCKKIVERHGGEIWIESEVGKGSTFYFTLKK